MFFVQTSTLPPRMHQNLTKHGKFCKQNNQLPTKNHVDLKDYSNRSLEDLVGVELHNNVVTLTSKEHCNFDS